MTTNLSLIIDVLKQDIKVAENAINEKDFGMVGTIGNRIMANLLADKSKTKELVLIGWILKEVGGELEVVKRFKDSSKLDNSTKIAKDTLKQIETTLSKKEYSANRLWGIYFDWEKDIREHILSKLEDKTYTKKVEFTREILLVLLDHFLTNKDLLLKQNAQLTKGILNDLTRVINEHGATETEYMVYIVFKVFDGYFTYTLHSETSFDGKINEENLKSKIDKYIDAIEKISKIYDAKELEEMYSEATAIVYELSIEIRKNFHSYYQPHTQVLERKLELPEEAKVKIGDAISKAFEETSE